MSYFIWAKEQGYKVTCKESDQDLIYIILYKFSKLAFMNFYIEIYGGNDNVVKYSKYIY
jgi:hypothetical protein